MRQNGTGAKVDKVSKAGTKSHMMHYILLCTLAEGEIVALKIGV